MTQANITTFNLSAEAGKFFDDSSLPISGDPQFALLLGGVCVGKTTYRRERYARGYVLIDAAEIFLSLSRGVYHDFPSTLEPPMDIVGRLVAERAFRERRNVVTEMIGSEFIPSKAVIDAVLALDYRVEVVTLTLDLDESIARNLHRGDDNISAYYTEGYHRRWILGATAESGQERKSSGNFHPVVFRNPTDGGKK